MINLNLVKSFQRFRKICAKCSLNSQELYDAYYFLGNPSKLERWKIAKIFPHIFWKFKF